MNSRVMALEGRRLALRSKIDLHENFPLASRISQAAQLRGAESASVVEEDRLARLKVQIEANITQLSKGLVSKFRLKEWLGREQRDLRRQVASLSEERDRAIRESGAKAREREGTAHRAARVEEEIHRHRTEPVAAWREELARVEADLEIDRPELKRLEEDRDEFERLREPLVQKFEDADRELAFKASSLNLARLYERRLDEAENGYEKHQIHEMSRESFGRTSPRSVIGQLESEIAGLERKREKLGRRLDTLVQRRRLAPRRIVIDGNNLCYRDGNIRVGLAPLRALVPVLAAKYDVHVVFDNEITSVVRMDAEAIRRVLRDAREVIISHSRFDADETIVEMTVDSPHTFILTGDGLDEYPDQEAVSADRILPPIITAERVMIHDLGINVAYRAGERA